MISLQRIRTLSLARALTGSAAAGSLLMSTLLALVLVLLTFALANVDTTHAAGVADFVSIPACPKVEGAAASGRLHFGLNNGTVDADHPTLRVSPPQCTLSTIPGDAAARSVMSVRNDSAQPVQVFLDVIELAPTTSGDSFVQPATSTAATRRARRQITLPDDRVEIPADKIVQVPFDVHLTADVVPGVHPFAVTASVRTSQPGSSSDGAARVSINTSLASEILVIVPGLVHEKPVIHGLQ
ncbi:MAG: hypothetical protein H7123_03025, partial [Thermoleophilia bacterium]|nr:hypothetical protein [Thermoleophilia bacterium]